MSAIPMSVPKGRPVTIEQVQAFLYSEARCLDDKDWDGWLAHYAPTATFWMPAWDDNDTLTEDPQREISLSDRARRACPSLVRRTTSPTWNCWKQETVL